MTRVADRSRLNARRGAVEALLVVLHCGLVGTVHMVATEDGVELADNNLHRSFDLERDRIKG